MRSEKRTTIRREVWGFSFRYPMEKDRTQAVVGLPIGYLDLDARKVRQLRKYKVCEA